MNKRIAMTVALLATTVAVYAQEASNIKEILIRGNRRVQNEVITSVMRTKVGQPYIQDNLDRDKRSIEDLGFFSAVSVRATPLELGAYSITVDVEEFPEIKEIRVSGNSVVTAEEILSVITLKPGQVFNANAVQPSIKAIEELYQRKGYFALIADFAPSTESEGTINVAVSELTVGTVSVQGNTRTKDWVMKRLIKTRSGDAFNGDQWGRDLRRVAGTGWFEPGSIKSIEDTEREPGKIDLTMEVKETRTGMFNVGLQVDPRSSFAGLIKVSDSNFNGTGKSIGLDFLQTTRGGGASVGLDYFDPFWDSKDTTFSASLYSRVIYRFSGVFSGSALEDDDSYNERRTGGSFGFSRPVNQDLTYGLNFRYEGVRTDLDADETSTNDFVKQDGSVGAVTLSAVRDRRDLALDPARGDYVRLLAEPGISKITSSQGAFDNPDLVGTHSFGKLSLEYRNYWSDQPPRGRNEPDAPRRVLATRVHYGTIAGTVPFFEQFFAGGANTIRGYDEDRFWGKNFLVTSAEYRYPIQRSFNAIAFVDYGGAWGGYGSLNNFTQSNKFKLHLGYGVGLSLRTPLGPIRIDLGFNEEGRSRTHFLIGTSF